MSLIMSCHLGLVEEKDGAAPVSFWGKGNLGCMEHPWEAHGRQQRYIWGPWEGAPLKLQLGHHKEPSVLKGTSVHM